MSTDWQPPMANDAVVPPDMEAGIRRMKDQLLIVLCKRLRLKGVKLEFPISEIDSTGNDTLTFEVDQIRRVFKFTLGKKPS